MILMSSRVFSFNRIYKVQYRQKPFNIKLFSQPHQILPLRLPLALSSLMKLPNLHLSPCEYLQIQTLLIRSGQIRSNQTQRLQERKILILFVRIEIVNLPEVESFLPFEYLVAHLHCTCLHPTLIYLALELGFILRLQGRVDIYLALEVHEEGGGEDFT